MPVLKVDRETVVELWGLPGDPNKEEGIEVISDEITDTSRWSVRYELIVSIKAKFYRTRYLIGSTENCDEQPWEYDKEVVFTEVEPVETVVVKYVPVKD